jgi:uncharacterized protein GlcG (DUF336 family)
VTIRRGALGTLLLALAGCSGGEGGIQAGGCDGYCADTPTRLEVAEVHGVIARAVHEATARGAAGTIAVVDRVGNVLGVFRMTGADTLIATDGGRGVTGGLDGLDGVTPGEGVPDTLAAIAKAITAAYLSSEGNAFTTRTASQIVQLHFYPGEFGQPSGPLFGVQFSQLPCSDLNTRFDGVTRPGVGPHRSPLGLAADSGGLPLYKNGTLVGGVGVIADGVYGLDRDIRNRDLDVDELVALAATAGFEAPVDRRADRITVDGKPLRFADATAADLAANPSAAPAYATIDGVAGALVAVPAYAGATIVAGTAFSHADSGIRAATGPFAALDAFVLVDGSDVPRYAPGAGTDAAAVGAAALIAPEVQQVLVSALTVANRARAQIRRPLGTPARVTISVVDSFGAVLGIVRTRDAPVFGIDVSLQKARVAAFLSNSAAAGDLAATPDAVYLTGGTSVLGDYVTRAQQFLGAPTALADGAIAFSARATGNLARPYFPDGLPDTEAGPFSTAIGAWSPFSTGLQLDLVNNAIGQHVVFVAGGGGSDTAPGSCTALPSTANGTNRLRNGIQIFPGGVPIYRGATLVGAIGVSGDGIDQDDMVAFLGLHEAALALGASFGHAPAAMRADTLTPQGVRLRYVQCPQSPYYASDAQNVCDGK